MSSNTSRDTLPHWDESSLYLVANGFSVEENFFLQEFKKTRREELKVLDIWLLGRTRRLGDRVQTMNIITILAR